MEHHLKRFCRLLSKLVNPPREVEGKDRLSRIISKTTPKTWIDKNSGEPGVECLYAPRKRDKVSNTHEVSMLLTSNLEKPGQNLKDGKVWHIAKRHVTSDVIGRLDFSAGTFHEKSLKTRHDSHPPHHIGVVDWPVFPNSGKLHKSAMMALAEQIYTKKLRNLFRGSVRALFLTSHCS